MSVTVVELDTLDWQASPSSWAGKAGPGQPQVRFKPFTTGSPSLPRGQLIEYEPGHTEPVHSHSEGELFYLLDGHLSIGDTVLGPGTVVYIGPGTEYAGCSNDGCHFLRLPLDADT